MAESEEGRVGDVNEYVSSLKERLKKANEVKELTVANQEQLREISVSLDVTIDNGQKSIEALSRIPSSVLGSVRPELWEYFQGLKTESVRQVGSLDAMANEVKQVAVIGGTVVSMVSGAASSSAIETRFVMSMLTTPEVPAQNRPLVIGIADTLSNDARAIQTELESIDREISTRFNEIMKDWSITPSDRKWQVLLTLRSVIFNQFFETWAAESDYSRAAWYRAGTNKGMRYAEPKFFMLGFGKEQDLSPAARIEIENVASQFQTNFGQLSEYGKEGTDNSIAEATFRETLSLLKQSLLVRKIWFKRTP